MEKVEKNFPPVPGTGSPVEKENLLAVLRSRRIQNFKSQFKSVILEGYEIFGFELVESVISECREIFEDYKKLTVDE